MKKDSLIIIAIVVLAVIMYALTLRGNPGNTGLSDMDISPTSAFESSHERVPYGHIVNMVERGSYDLSQEWAEASLPDVGISADGRYYGFFAPGVPYLTLPFFFLGFNYGLGQVFTFAAESLISIITLIFIFLIGRRVFEMPMWAAFFAALIYGFASTSWSYAITLYQHTFTAFFIVTSFYAAWRFANHTGPRAWMYAAYVWLAYALAIFVDYPNAILMLPVMLYLAFSTFVFRKIGEDYSFSIRFSALATALVFAAVTGAHLWHNAHYLGSPTQTSNGLKSYVYEGALASEELQKQKVLRADEISAEEGKDIVGFFSESEMPNGFYILMLSDERGLFFFAPIFLLALFGIRHALRELEKMKERSAFFVLLALVAVNIFLYSSWGDPWGGWAYGPRYLIPSMPWFALFSALALTYGKNVVLKKGFAFFLFLYSSAIALLGALTTNAVPTKSEGLLLPAKKYNYLYNMNFMEENRSGSFFYNSYIAEYSTLSLMEYFFIIYSALVLIALITLLVSRGENNLSRE